MDLASSAASLLCHPTGRGKRVVAWTGSLVSTPNATTTTRELSQSLSTSHKRFPRLAAQPTTSTSTRQEAEAEIELENSKFELLTAIQDTQRGLVTSSHQRSLIEDALVSVEGYDAGAPFELGKLDGTWRLQYTSAPDVLILLESSARLPFFQVGQIYQKFECQDQANGGFIRNVVQWSIPKFLEDQEGATLIVSAKFSIVSPRNIYLHFEEIAVQNVRISEELQALIAPAVLPRSFLSLQMLQLIRAFKAQVPVRNPGRRSTGGLYYLSYLDSNMLLGRAGGGGAFVFTRAQNFV